MKSRLLPILCAFIFLSLSSCKVADVMSTSQAVSHEKWNQLVKTHVNAEGWVDYNGFKKDSVRFNDYLSLLKSNHPNQDNWTVDERKAYWINAYNAFTIKLIVDHYPLESIKDIKRGIVFVNTVWDIKFIEIENETYDLNNIEHGILRPKFDDPRIHFALNCASVSCPPLANFAYEADSLDSQLDRMARRFLADEIRNNIESSDQVSISSIFSWFKGDFTKNGSLLSFIDQYTEVDISEDAKVEYLDYDWGINSSDHNR